MKLKSGEGGEGRCERCGNGLLGVCVVVAQRGGKEASTVDTVEDDKNVESLCTRILQCAVVSGQQCSVRRALFALSALKQTSAPASYCKGGVPFKSNDGFAALVY